MPKTYRNLLHKGIKRFEKSWGDRVPEDPFIRRIAEMELGTLTMMATYAKAEAFDEKKRRV